MMKLEDFPVPPWVHLGMMKEEIARSSRFIAQERIGTPIMGPGTDWKKRQRQNPVPARALCARAQPGRIGKNEGN
jgi:hypothetical protein